MPRTARIVIPGWAYHITQRGNRREDIFHVDDLRRRYLQLLEQYSAGRMTIRAFCLMSNHVHLVAVPQDVNALAETLKPVHSRYAQEYNYQMGLTGILWQGRFYSCLLEGDHYWTAIRYVERNPVRAGIVKRAEHYPWSSAGWRCGLRRDSLLTETGPLDWPQWLWNLPRHQQQAGWSNWLAETEDEATLRLLRDHTKTGRPIGTKAGLAGLEERLGVRLLPSPRGRPRKEK